MYNRRNIHEYVVVCPVCNVYLLNVSHRKLMSDTNQVLTSHVLEKVIDMSQAIIRTLMEILYI